jgi:transcriptional regulator with XRE-family HTH domain
VHRFAHELRLLRLKAGSPSYRAMAQRTGVSVTTLSRAAAGDRLPSAEVVLAYARACDADPGEAEPDEWEARWKEAAEEEFSLWGPVPAATAGPM